MPTTSITKPKTEKAKKTTTSAAPKAPAKVKIAKVVKVAKETAVSLEKQMIRIKISAYEHKVLDQSVKQVIDTVARHDSLVRGPVPLPTEIKKYTVNRSSFIDKNAREQFEMRIHRRIIDIMSPSPKIVEALANLNLPSGVNVDVKMV